MYKSTSALWPWSQHCKFNYFASENLILSLHTRSMFALEVWQCHTLSNRVKALNPFCPYCQLRISARVVVYLMRRRVWRVIITQRILPSLLSTIPPRRSIIKQSDFNFSFWRGKNLGILKLVCRQQFKIQSWIRSVFCNHHTITNQFWFTFGDPNIPGGEMLQPFPYF